MLPGSVRLTCPALRFIFTRATRLFLLLFILGGIGQEAQATTITLVQHAGKDAGIVSSSSLAFPSNNTAGNWIAVVIRAGKSGQVFTVTDSNKNTYRSAFQFNVTADTPNGDTVGIFYGENIAGGANTVTVTESISSNTLRFAILEYSGVATANSFDTAIGSQGTSNSPNSTAASTTANGDLLLGVVVTANGATYTAGSGFTIEDRVPASPKTKLITEDQVQAVAGPASASASLAASDIWAAAFAAFKAASAGPAPPSITSLSPTSGPVTTPVTITGTNFGTKQSSSTVTFNGVSAGTASSWTATSITVLVPAGATTGNVVVTVSGQASNAVNFTVTLPPPIISSLSPTSGPVTASVTITGTNFGASQGTSTVTFNGTLAPNLLSWSATSIVVLVPPGATTGNVVVTVGGIASKGVNFTVAPTIAIFNPSTGPPGTSVTITGTGFGTTQGTSTVTFNGLNATPTSWNNTTIVVPVPAGATTGSIVVTVSGFASTGGTFLVTPNITGLNPTSGPVGTLVTITGTNFGATQGISSVTFNGTAATPTSWSDTNIVVAVPNAIIGPSNPVPVIVTVGGAASGVANFTFIPPGIAALSPTSGPIGTLLTITGTNFGSAQGASAVKFSGVAATPTSWGNTSIVVPVPTGVTAGPASVVVTVGGFASNSLNFGVAPVITSLNPSSGPIGTPVTINGSNFGASKGFSSITFSGIPIAPTSWSDTSIAISVPSGATTGNVVVTVGSVASNGVSFTVTPSPTITSLSPSSGPIGTVVTISGSNFGATQGGSTVSFNGTPATPTSWSATSIVVPLPANASTGLVFVDLSGIFSNGYTFTVTPPLPSITNLSPTSGTVGTSVTITGINFGSALQGTVTFNGVVATPSNWTSTSIVAPAPSAATTGDVVVTVSPGSTGYLSNGVPFAVLPSIVSLSPASRAVGQSVVVNGGGFGVSQGTSAITFNGVLATPTSWSTNLIIAPVPAGADTGNVVVTVGGVPSNAAAFTVIPSLSSVSPAFAPINTSVTISGNAFGQTQGTSTVTFNGTPAAPSSWSDSNIVVPVPAGATTGSVFVTVGGNTSNGVGFTITPVTITSLSPTSGMVGTVVTISGANFGSTTGSVTFNNAPATPNSWSATSIVVPVPSGATTGNVVVTVGGQASNPVPFTVIPPAGPINLVQHASRDAGITTSASLAFPANNTAGNWIAVCIRAGKAGQAITVSDSQNNKYNRAVLFNMTVDSETLAIFYAENVAGGANTVNVSDTISSGTLRFAVFEYSGIAAANSLDASAAAEGVSAAPSSSNAVTTANGDLVLGTITTANAATYIAGSGFSIEEVAPAEPNSKAMFEDGIQSVAGPVAATASLAASDSWGAAVTAFKSTGGAAGGGPTITSLSPPSGPAGTPVTITGTNFGSSIGSSIVGFNLTPATPTFWSSTSITVPVPSGATTGNVVVTVNGIQSNGVNFITGPIIVSVSPTSPTVVAGTSQPFTGSTQNDPASAGVSWGLSGPGCSGAACGSLSSITPTSVIYMAPNPAPKPPTVSLVATSVTDSTKSATATVTIGPPPPIVITVQPATSTVSINLTQLFSATVQNDSSNQGVNWGLSGAGCSGATCGTLTNATVSGNTFGITYTAPNAVPSPATVTVTATSVADNTKSGSATVTVSQGIPTSLGWYQIPNTMQQPVCPNIPQIQGAIGCQGVIAAWNGGIADTTRNRLLFTGGGHQNYWGNEVYSLNLSNLTLTRINNPVFPSSIPSCTEDWGNPPTTPSTPAARETYSGLAYVQHLDKMWLFGGALGTSGCRSTGLWMLDLPTLIWQRMDPTNGVQETVYTDINYADYDPQTKLVYVYIANNDVLASYSPDTNTMTELLNHNSYGTPSYSNGVLDPKRHWFFIFGAGTAQYYDLTQSPPAVHRFSSQTVGCSGMQSPNYPGLAYDSVQDKIVGWAGGNTVYVFDQTTFTCNAVTYPNGPPAQQTNGTYGRWRYFPGLNLFALVNDWQQNAYTLRLTPAP